MRLITFGLQNEIVTSLFTLTKRPNLEQQVNSERMWYAQLLACLLYGWSPRLERRRCCAYFLNATKNMQLWLSYCVLRHLFYFYAESICIGHAIGSKPYRTIGCVI